MECRQDLFLSCVCVCGRVELEIKQISHSNSSTAPNQTEPNIYVFFSSCKKVKSKENEQRGQRSRICRICLCFPYRFGISGAQERASPQLLVTQNSSKTKAITNIFSSRLNRSKAKQSKESIAHIIIVC